MRTFITASLDSERDSDILAWAAEQENLSAAVRTAIRAYIAGGVTLADVHEEMVAMADALDALVAERAIAK